MNLPKLDEKSQAEFDLMETVDKAIVEHTNSEQWVETFEIQVPGNFTPDQLARLTVYLHSQGWDPTYTKVGEPGNELLHILIEML